MKKITLIIAVLLWTSSFINAETGWFNDFLTVKVNGVEAPNNYYIGTNPATGALPFQGTAFGTVTSLEITACNMKYWSDTHDRTGGSFFYKIMSADGLTEIVPTTEVIWDHVALTGNDYQGTKTTNINLLTGLSSGSYQLYVWAKSWGTTQGDSWLSNSSANYVSTFSVSFPVAISGANGIVDGTGYWTLKAAFDALNLIADQTGKNIEIKISGNTTETATAALNQPATASWTSLTIYPTATATIEGSFVGTIIDLNGADNVTINGKLNKVGAEKTLTISHTSNADNGNRTIRLTNDAKSNTIQYANIIGKCPSTGAGVIFFSTTTGVDGNDNNIVEYCDINAMGAAAVGIGSGGTADKSNSGNIIRNNNIFDFYLGTTSTTSTYGINVGANNTDWTISGNSLYQTASRAYINTGTTYTFHYGIYVSAATGSGVNFTIADNYIGGSAPMAGGTPWTVSGGFGRPNPLYTSVGTTTASSIQGNVISNFDITTDFVTNGGSAFIGYWHAAGTVNVGTVTGNTIGSSDSNGAIVVKSNGVYNSTAGPLLVGMNIVTASGVSMVYSNNKIGGILYDLSNGNRGHLYVISVSGAGALTFTNNTIGSTTVANNIEHKGSTFAGQVNLRGISSGNAGILTCTGNTIASLTSSSTAQMTVNGIFHNGGGVNNISNNIIRDIKSYGTRVIGTQGSDASLIGLVFGSNSVGNTIGGNTIYNLNNANTTLATDVYGINFHSLNAGASSIENNKIYNLTTASTNTAANVVGISITRGLTNTRNNMITLGNGITNAVSIAGIRKFGTAITQNNAFYHNTVVITGSNVGVAGASSTAAFVRAYSATDELKNNIFINERSNASGNTQKHYAVNVNDLTTFSSDYNVVNYTGTGGLAGAVGATDYALAQDWVTATSQDTHSKVSTVNFTDAANGDLKISGASVKDNNLSVPLLATVSNDILGTVRSNPTYAGAHEAALPFIVPMSGTYKVGTSEISPNFSSLSNAVDALNENGVGGNVVLEISSDLTEPTNMGLAVNTGTYGITIRPDAEADRTVTFTQAAANVGPYGHFVIGCATANLTVAISESTLQNTNNITIDGFALDGSTRRLKLTTSATGIANSTLTTIVGNCQNIIVKNCIYDAKSTTATPRCLNLFVVKNGAKDVAPSNVLIDNNEIYSIPSTTVNGTAIQCTATGSASAIIENLDIRNNKIIASSTGIEIRFVNGVEITGNEIKMQKGTQTGGIYGIWLRGNTGNMNIIGNKFTETSTSQASSTVLIQTISIAANVSNPFNINIFNNTFSGMDRKATGATAINQYYIGEIGFGTTKIYHNTFYLPALTQPTQNGSYNAIAFTTANYKADIQNNIFISNEDAKSILISKAITSGAVKNNIYYLKAGNTNAKIVDTYSTMSSYQTANPTLDINSRYGNVEFTNEATGDLTIAGLSVKDNLLRIPSIAEVTTDILGTVRNTSYTYAGAHEAALPFLTTGIEKAIMQANIEITKTGIVIRTDKNSSIELFNMNGILVDRVMVNGTYSRSLNNGVYVVRINGKATKFVK